VKENEINEKHYFIYLVDLFGHAYYRIIASARIVSCGNKRRLYRGDFDTTKVLPKKDF
jgi:hypothetical protein